jgi:hypothetical protein
VDRRHEVIVARGDRSAVRFGGARLGLAPARAVGESRLDVGVFPDALADGGKIGAGLDAAGGVQVERARLVPIDADRAEHIVERPALLGPAPHLRLAFGRLGLAFGNVRHRALVHHRTGTMTRQRCNFNPTRTTLAW